MPKDAEARAIRDACAALSPLNKRRVYDVAYALEFAEKRPVKAAGRGLAGIFSEVPRRGGSRGEVKGD